MIEQRIRDQLSTAYETRVLIHDADAFSTVFDYVSLLAALGYEVIKYEDVERFRYVYETDIKMSGKQIAVIAENHHFIPYDIRKAFYEVSLSLETVYPRLNAATLRKHLNDLAVIDFAYDALYADVKTEKQTERFIAQSALSTENIKRYVTMTDVSLVDAAQKASSPAEWISIAKQNAKLEVYAASIGLDRQQKIINECFVAFVFDGYQKLSGMISKDAPAILPKAIDMISGGKVALIVADGMSLFDYEILSRSLSDFDRDYYCSFAMIPTTTSISRQSLLSGKYPQQLDNPFSLSKEESGFIEAGLSHGYSKQQCFYGRGYDAIPGPLVRFAAIIINDIDDMVHGQKQGRQGMYNDVSLLSKSGSIQRLISDLLDKGFSVYLTADHGNTCCVGGGSSKRTGVETETKSKRMLVLKDFADISDEVADRMIVYPGYYMDKSYQYLICKGNTSFDNKNETVMTHGGITLEEVIVPFVKIRRKHNG